MSQRLPQSHRDHLLNDRGPYRSVVVDINSTLSVGTPDGTWDKPFTSIQAAVNSFPGGDTGLKIILINAGTYLEGGALALGNGPWMLVGLGPVYIGDIGQEVAVTWNPAVPSTLALSGGGDQYTGVALIGTLAISGGANEHHLNLSNVSITGAVSHDGGTTNNIQVHLKDVIFSSSFTGSRFTLEISDQVDFNGNVTIRRIHARLNSMRFAVGTTLTIGEAGSSRAMITASDLQMDAINVVGGVGPLNLVMDEFTYRRKNPALVVGSGVTLDTKTHQGPGRMVVVDGGAATGGDGTWAFPYKTIQSALNAKPAVGTNPEVDDHGWNILILAGRYDESPTFTGQGIVNLVCLGRVLLMGAGGAARHLTLNFNGDVNGNNNFYIWGSGSDGDADHSGFVLSGNLTIDNPTFVFNAGFTADHLLVQGSVSTFGWEGILTINLRNSFITGTFTHGGAGTVEVAAEHSTFQGNVTITTLGSARDCMFGGNVTLTSGGRFLGCIFNGGAVLTGPPGNSIEMDGPSHFQFLNEGGTLAGGALIEMQSHDAVGPHDLTKMVVVDNGSTGSLEDGTWQHPFKTIQAALNSFVPPGAPSHDALNGMVVFVMPGIYEESLAVPSTGTIVMVTPGIVQLGRSNLLGLPPGTAMNVSRAGGAPVLSTTFAMIGLAPGTWIISGNIAFSGAAQFAVLRGVHVVGSVNAFTAVSGTQQFNVIDCVFDGGVTIDGVLNAERSTFESAVNVSNAVSGRGELTSARDCLFTTLLEVFDYVLIDNCRFQANIDINKAGGVTGMFRNCNWEGTFSVTGDANCFVVDGASYDSFFRAGGTFAGGLTADSIIFADAVRHRRSVFIPGAMFQVMATAATVDRSRQNPGPGGTIPTVRLTAGFAGLQPVFVCPFFTHEMWALATRGWRIDTVTVFYDNVGGSMDAASTGVNVTLAMGDANDVSSDIVVSNKGISPDLAVGTQRAAGRHKLTYSVVIPDFANESGFWLEVSPDLSGAPTLTEWRLYGVEMKLTSVY